MLSKKRIFGLDVLRAIAIILVIVSHATYLVFPIEQHPLLSTVRAMGAVGVDLFFVLSGFLIGGILLKHCQKNKLHFSDLSLFLKRRWLRTLPNYLVVLIINIILIYFYKGEIIDSAFLYFIFMQNFYTPHPNFFTEAWSLSVEEYAYLILPIIMYVTSFLLPKRDKEKLFFQTTLVVVLILWGIKINYFFNAQMTSYQQWSATFRKIVLYRIDAIYLGFLLVYLFEKYKSKWVSKKGELLSFGLVSFVGLHLYIYVFNVLPQTNLSFYVFLYLQVISISLLAVFPFFIGMSTFTCCTKIIQYISTRSYAIYLVNYSIVLLSIENFFDIEKASLFTKIEFLILYLLFTWLLSETLYRTIELPILRFRKEKFPATR